jgi:hypothetical protein
VGKEVKGRTHTFYQVLIDSRDCPYIVGTGRTIVTLVVLDYKPYMLELVARF